MWISLLCIPLISGIRAKVRDGWGWGKVGDSTAMAEYDEGFADKKPTNMGRDKVMCGMAVGPCTVDQSWYSWGVVSQERFVWTWDGRDHRNFFNGLINQVNYLDNTIVVLLEAEGLRKQELGDSSDGMALVVVDACDFVDGYIIMMKNGALKFINTQKVGRARGGGCWT